MIPIPMILHCPTCGGRHVDVGVFADKPHHTHACQHCGFVWRPAVVPTVGVQFLPGFRDALAEKTGAAQPRHEWTGRFSFNVNVLWVEGRCAGVLEPEKNLDQGPTHWVFRHADGRTATTEDVLPQTRYDEVCAWALRQATGATTCTR